MFNLLTALWINVRTNQLYICSNFALLCMFWINLNFFEPKYHSGVFVCPWYEYLSLQTNFLANWIFSCAKNCELVHRSKLGLNISQIIKIYMCVCVEKHRNKNYIKWLLNWFDWRRRKSLNEVIKMMDEERRNEKENH